MNIVKFFGWDNPGLFLLIFVFSSFPHYTNQYKLKKRRGRAWDSDPGKAQTNPLSYGNIKSLLAVVSRAVGKAIASNSTDSWFKSHPTIPVLYLFSKCMKKRSGIVNLKKCCSGYQNFCEDVEDFKTKNLF